MNWPQLRIGASGVRRQTDRAAQLSVAGRTGTRNLLFHRCSSVSRLGRPRLQAAAVQGGSAQKAQSLLPVLVSSKGLCPSPSGESQERNFRTQSLSPEALPFNIITPALRFRGT